MCGRVGEWECGRVSVWACERVWCVGVWTCVACVRVSVWAYAHVGV